MNDELKELFVDEVYADFEKWRDELVEFNRNNHKGLHADFTQWTAWKEAAIKYAAASQWIDVLERLPERGETFWTPNQNGEAPTRYNRNNRDSDEDWADFFKRKEITHWMYPLPLPP